MRGTGGFSRRSIPRSKHRGRGMVIPQEYFFLFVEVIKGFPNDDRIRHVPICVPCLGHNMDVSVKHRDSTKPPGAMTNGLLCWEMGINGVYPPSWHFTSGIDDQPWDFWGI